MFFLYCPFSYLRKLLLLKPISLIKADEYFRDCSRKFKQKGSTRVTPMSC